MNEADNSPAPDTSSPAMGEDAAAPGMVHQEPASERAPADLDAISSDLDGVEAALARLADGTYWTDEVTGEPIPDDVVAANPVARRTDATGA